MSEYLPKEVRAGLALARKAKQRSSSRMRVRTGEQTFTILRHWENGFALDADEAMPLRGLVDVFDGPRHVSNCLIVASESDGDEIVCEYKRVTPALDRAPQDYEVADDAPVALIGRD